jgi:hypothetical protein
LDCSQQNGDVLGKKLETSLENSAKIMEACAWMRNYVLDCKIKKELTVAERGGK